MKTYTVLLDGYEANSSQRVGSNVYAFELLKALEKRSRKSKQLQFSIVLPNKKCDELPKEREGWKYIILSSSRLYSQWSLPIFLFKNKKQFDLFFTTSHYAPRYCPVPYISSVMDVGYLEYPQFFKKSDLAKLTLWTRYSVKKATKVLAISQYTKSQVIKHYHRKKNDVFVAYPSHTIGRSDSKNIDGNTLKKWKLEKKKYILFNGTIQPRKNIISLVKAFSILKQNQKYNDIKLVLAGKVGWLASDTLKAISDSPHTSDIVQTGFVSETDKNTLLAHAATVTMVGLHEGFGIPALESQVYGVVPVVSDTSSLPEVVGDAGILVDPSNPEDIAQGLEQILTMKQSEVKKRQRMMKKNIDKYTWANTADRVYKMMLKTMKEIKSKK